VVTYIFEEKKSLIFIIFFLKKSYIAKSFLIISIAFLAAQKKSCKDSFLTFS